MQTTIDSNPGILVERFPEQLVDRSWRSYLASIGIPCGAFCCLPLTLAAFDSSIDIHGPMRWIGAASLTGMLLGFLALLLFSTASILHQRLRANLPTVQLLAEELTLQCGHATLSANIRECRVRRGRAYSMRIGAVPMGIAMYCWFPVILIHMPPFERTIAGVYYSRNVVAVGLTEKSLTRWERALLPGVGEPSVATEAAS